MSELPSPDVLTALVRRHVDPHATCTGIERTAVGNSQETYYLDVTGGDAPSALVLRRTAAAGTIEWTERAVEVAALAAAAAAGAPVPRVWWWEPDGGSLDRAYLVMDRAPGQPPDLRRPEVGSRLAADLGHHLARVHRAEVPVSLRPRDPSASTATATELQRWTARARATGIAPELAIAVLGWLAARPPDDDVAGVLLWGDPGPHNVLTDGAGAVTALLDWELAQFGHPAQDLGAARWSCLGHLDRDVLTAAYTSERGGSLDPVTVAWFESLACVSRSVMLLDGVRAALDGRAHDPNVLALGRAMVSANLVRAAVLAWGDDVAADPPPGTPPARLHPTPDEAEVILARFFADAAPAIDDARRRRGLRIASALLACDAAPVSPTDSGHAAETAYRRERAGEVDEGARRALVTCMLAARRADQPLLDLYGPTTAIPHPG